MKPLSSIAGAVLLAVVEAEVSLLSRRAAMHVHCSFALVNSTDLSEPAQLAFSPPHYPSPWMDPHAPGWEVAYAQARDFVSQLTMLEKVNLTTGIGCVRAGPFL